jgi:hypothetical protein
MFEVGQQIALIDDLNETYVVKEVHNTPTRQILDLITSTGTVITDWSTYYVPIGTFDN